LLGCPLRVSLRKHYRNSVNNSNFITHALFLLLSKFVKLSNTTVVFDTDALKTPAYERTYCFGPSSISQSLHSWVYCVSAALLHYNVICMHGIHTVVQSDAHRGIADYSERWIVCSDRTARLEMGIWSNMQRNKMRSRNTDELSAWSCVSMTSMALPAKTTTKSNPADPRHWLNISRHPSVAGDFHIKTWNEDRNA